MDEPLSNLDAKLRVQMRTEVSRLQHRLEHDHRLRHPRPDRGDDARRPRRGDARRGAAAGRLPAELYDGPDNLFVAGFIGSPAMNFMPARSPRRRRPSCRSSRSTSTTRLQQALGDARGTGTCSPASGPSTSRTRRSSASRTPGDDLRGQGRPPRVDGLRALHLLHRSSRRAWSQTSSTRLAADTGRRGRRREGAQPDRRAARRRLGDQARRRRSRSVVDRDKAPSSSISESGESLGMDVGRIRASAWPLRAGLASPRGCARSRRRPSRGCGAAGNAAGPPGCRPRSRCRPLRRAPPRGASRRTGIVLVAEPEPRRLARARMNAPCACIRRKPQASTPSARPAYQARLRSWMRLRCVRRQRHALEEEPLVAFQRQVAETDRGVGTTSVWISVTLASITSRPSCAGDRDPVVAVLDEVQLADPVDVDRRHRLSPAHRLAIRCQRSVPGARWAEVAVELAASGRPCRRSSRAGSSAARVGALRAGRVRRRPRRTAGSG